MQQNYGVKSIQSLDPFVKLLIDAFSTEVFKANNEIQNVNSRLLERLARMLTPTKYTHPIAGSCNCILYAGRRRGICNGLHRVFL